MKKSLSIFCAVLTAGMLTAPAYAANPYISGNCGATWFDNINTSAGAQLISGGINVTGAVGMAMDNFRLEAEVGNQTNIDQVITAVFGLNGGSVSATSLLVNAYYDIKGGGVEPYLTAGVGPTWISADDWVALPGNKRYSAKYTTLGYQFGAGVAIPLSDHFAIDARYRYFGTSTINDNTIGNFKIASSSALVGLRYEF